MAEVARHTFNSSAPRVRALERPRLSAKLEQTWTVPLTVVAAPAGSGKSWLLAGFAHADRDPGRTVAWYDADQATVDAAGLLQQLFAALTNAGVVSGSTPSCVDDFVSAVRAAPARETVLVVDDVQVLAGSRAEAVLGELATRLPSSLHVALLSRQPLGFDLTRLRVADQMLELGPDELRFRSWEVSDLFRRHHGHDLPPEEIAELARRTGGWAAGLHLFHLAIKGKPAAYRRQILASLPTRLRTCRDYLTENVLAGLEEELRGFVGQTSVLGVLSAARCDALLDRRDSAAVLDELSARHLFLTTTDGVSYRMHEVLRGHLEQLLFEQLGEEAARTHCLRAAYILEREGALGEAWRAFCRAQDWESAQRLFDGPEGDFLEAASTWSEPLTGPLAGSDARILLARARRQVLAGRWQQALDTFRRAERLADVPRLAEICTAELMALEGWVEPTSTVPIGWSGLLRQVLTAGPGILVNTSAGEPIDQLVAAVAALLAGMPTRAWDLLRDGLEPASAALSQWATLVGALSGCLLGRNGNRELAAAASAELEAALPPWIVRFLELLSDSDAALVAEVAESLAPEVSDTANPWAEAALGLVLATAELLSGGGSARAHAERSLELARLLGSRTLQVWSSLLVAVMSLTDGEVGAEGQLRAVESLARSTGCPGAAFLARLMSEEGHPGPSSAFGATGLPAGDTAFWCGVAERLRQLPAELTSAPESPATGGTRGPVDAAFADPVVRLQCFGDFEISVGGRRLDTSRAQPKVRALLHLLAVNAGHVVHRDRLATSLWSYTGHAATRNLQVAVSSLRKFLDASVDDPAADDASADDASASASADDDCSGSGRPPVRPGGLIKRRGDGYMIEVGTDGSDVRRFHAAVLAGQASFARDEAWAAARSWRQALELYRGDLLSSEGTADWIVEERESFRVRAAEVAERLAAHLLASGNADEAIRVATRGLEIDRYRDGLWRTAISAHLVSGDVAAAARATTEYNKVLDTLGLQPDLPTLALAHS